MIATSELYDPARRTFVPGPRMRSGRAGTTATVLRDGRVLIAGLRDGRVLVAGEVPRYKAAAITLADGRVLVIGGSADIEGTRVYRTTELYDPRLNRFLPGPTMRHARYKLTGSVVRLPDDRVLVAGGAATPELFDPVAARFQPVRGRIDSTRLFLTATLVGDGRVLLVGGYGLNVTPTALAWRY